MIPSYAQSIHNRKKKGLIFWMIVLFFTGFLYLFFQGYYINYQELFRSVDTSKQSFLKPFGIIDLHVFPSPDRISINGDNYDNSSKTIFDLGSYIVSIKKEGYISLEFPIKITKTNPFYSNTVNLLRLPEYQPTGLDFDRIDRVNGVFFAKPASGNIVWILDDAYQIIRIINNGYVYLGAEYFTSGNMLFEYDREGDKFKSVLSPETNKPVECSSWKLLGDAPFCPELSKFFGLGTPGITEPIREANNQLVVTDRYIYNQDKNAPTWQYYEYQNKSIHSPISLIHIENIPFVLENSSLAPLDKTATGTHTSIPMIWLDAIESAEDFGSETILIGTKEKKNTFVLVDGEKRFFGELGLIDLKDIQVQKINGVYVFYSKNGAYLYYQGSKNVFKILGDPVINIIGSTLYFKKDGKVMVMDLLRK